MPILYACTQCGAKSDKRRCPKHRRKDKRPSASARGYDSRWRKTRADYIAKHPICEEPGCTEPTVDVHHKDGLGPKGPRGHDEENLEGLCHGHHSQRTTTDQPGGWWGDLLADR